MRRVFVILLATLMSLANYSCKSVRTIEVEKPVYIHDTTEVRTQILDSIFVDKYHEVSISSDTVFIRDSISLVRYKIEKDTVYAYSEQPIEITKEVFVEKDHSGIEKFLMFFGVLALLVILCVMLYCLYKKIR